MSTLEAFKAAIRTHDAAVERYTALQRDYYHSPMARRAATTAVTQAHNHLVDMRLANDVTILAAELAHVSKPQRAREVSL